MFNQLQSFKWVVRRVAFEPCLHFLKVLTKAQMPKINEFYLSCYTNYFEEKEFSHEFFAFIQSKKTLKSIEIWPNFQNRSEIVRGIIEILNTQSRPCLHLTLYTGGEEKVSKIDTISRRRKTQTLYTLYIK